MSTQKKQQQRRRLACDRCHSFKLKCPRSSLQSEDPCARCLKAGVACFYSLSMRGQIRAKQAYTRTTPVGLDSFYDESPVGDVAMPGFESDDFFNNMVLDWSGTGHGEGDGFLESIPSIPQLQPDTSENGTSNTAHSSHSGNSIEQDNLIQILPHEPIARPQSSPYYLGYSVPDTLQSPDVFLQLTHILVTLEGLARHLPSFQTHDSSAEPTSSTTSSAEVDHNYGVSKAFAITSKLADIYIPLIEQTQQRRDQKKKKNNNNNNTEIDYSLLHLLFACHNRLIDQWHSMLKHAEIVHKTSPDGQTRQSRCAQLSLGSYVPSSSATVVPMEIIMLQELAMHLASRVDDLIGVVAANNKQEADNDIIDHHHIALSAKALHERALGMRADIARLKSQLEDATVKITYI